MSLNQYSILNSHKVIHMLAQGHLQLKRPATASFGSTSSVESVTPEAQFLNQPVGKHRKHNLEDELPVIQSLSAKMCRQTSPEASVNQCQWGSCNKSDFESNREFYDHVGEHFKVSKDVRKKCKCEWKSCSYVSTNFCSFAIHILSHTGEKPHKCPKQGCSKAFITKSNMQIHQRTHTGEKLHKCPEEGCSKAFITKSNMLIHQRTHTGHKPFKCRLAWCKYRSAQSSYFNRHFKTHHPTENQDERLWVKHLEPDLTSKLNEPSKSEKPGSGLDS